MSSNASSTRGCRAPLGPNVDHGCAASDGTGDGIGAGAIVAASDGTGAGAIVAARTEGVTLGGSDWTAITDAFVAGAAGLELTAGCGRLLTGSNSS